MVDIKSLVLQIEQSGLPQGLQRAVDMHWRQSERLRKRLLRGRHLARVRKDEPRRFSTHVNLAEEVGHRRLRGKSAVARQPFAENGNLHQRFAPEECVHFRAFLHQAEHLGMGVRRRWCFEPRHPDCCPNSRCATSRGLERRSVCRSCEFVRDPSRFQLCRQSNPLSTTTEKCGTSPADKMSLPLGRMRTSPLMLATALASSLVRSPMEDRWLESASPINAVTSRQICFDEQRALALGWQKEVVLPPR